MPATAPPRPGGASRVFLGVLLSRIAGFVRDRAVAHYFGVGPHADVFRTALRGPNLLQNLLGEGTISAAFIPIYSRLLGEGRERDAGRFAGAVFGLLLALAAALALAGVWLARPIVALLAPGFAGDAAGVAAGTLEVDRHALAVAAVRLIFPMTGILVLSAWALGVLNSHRRFFLPYVAPVLWNAAIVAGLLWAAGQPLGLAGPAFLDRLLLAACLGALVGGVLQFAVQLPLVAGEMRGFRLSLSTRIDGVREALRASGPAIAGRGVYQLSAYLDLILASWLAAGAVAALGWAQTLYVLPVSLFGLSVAAAELPELARQGRSGADPALAERLRGALARSAFLVVPSAVGYLFFGFLLVGALYRTGNFRLVDNWLVTWVLAGYSLGLVATACSRLLANAFYATGDTRTPARVAAARVLVSALVAVPLMLAFDRLPVRAGGIEEGPWLRLGAVGLALAASVGAWVELAALGRRAGRLLPGFAFPAGRIGQMAALALSAALPAIGLWYLLPAGLHVAFAAALVVGLYGVLYLGAARLAGLAEATALLGRLPPDRGRRGW